MDEATMLQAISTVGFPIVMCIALFWYIYKQDERHKEETAKLSEAINNNTTVMQQLLTKMEAVLK